LSKRKSIKQAALFLNISFETYLRRIQDREKSSQQNKKKNGKKNNFLIVELFNYLLYIFSRVHQERKQIKRKRLLKHSAMVQQLALLELH
jgi:hypothetical protein